MSMIEIDGSLGEGGGQLLRTALSMSMLLQRPLHFVRIRAGRKKPGLMRQHLAAVTAAQQVSGARVSGASLGSTELTFAPQALIAGHYDIDIGSAGSTTLVLQTVLLPLLAADALSEIRISGGTHNMLAPSSEFLQRCFLPQLRAMGADVDLTLERHGLFPAGRGCLVCKIRPSTLAPIQRNQRGALLQLDAEALVASVPGHVAVRELEVVRRHFKLAPEAGRLLDLGHSTGPGNVLSLWVQFEHVCELVTAHGERGISAERVATNACRALDAHLQSDAAVGEHLADQLLLPLWLAGGGEFVTGPASDHLRSNAALIEQISGDHVELSTHGALTTVRVIRRG